MTNTELAITLAPLEVAYGKPITEQHAAIFQSILGGIELKHLQIAVQRYLRTNEFNALPAPGLLLRYADEAANGIEMTADQAVSLIWQAIKKHRGYDMDCHRAAYADLGPKIGAAMDAAGGYQRFCDCTSDDKGTLVAQFRQAWDAQVRREEQQRRLPAALVPRVNGPTHQPRIETPATPRLVAQGENS